MSIGYVIRRIFFFVLVIWTTATVNFIVVHASPTDPISQELGRMASLGVNVQGAGKIIASYKKAYGLDGSLFTQYWHYLASLAHLNLGYSLTNFPLKVTTLIQSALPWTLGLLFTSTLLSFLIGSILGGLMVWRASSVLARSVLPVLMILAAIPYYLLALVLLYLFAFTFHVFPASGSTSILSLGESPFRHILDVIDHSILPALSIVLSAVGFWMLSMRSLTVSVLGADYLALAEAKGLKTRRIFIWYVMRNAILPQVTTLAIALGYVASGAVLVEVIFSYPGLGNLLYTAIRASDYPMIEGITLIIVVAVSSAILVLDLLYPRLDPRIAYEHR